MSESTKTKAQAPPSKSACFATSVLVTERAAREIALMIAVTSASPYFRSNELDAVAGGQSLHPATTSGEFPCGGEAR